MSSVSTVETPAGQLETPSGKGAGDENFPVGSWLLPARLRPHVAIFYAFARAIDDIADNPGLAAADKVAQLDGFARAIEGEITGLPGYEKAYRMRASLRETGVPTRHCLDLVAAFKQDANKLRYRDWDDLMGYCILSAAPVGRYLLDLHGEPRDGYAASDALCNALQVINHLQDVKDDYLDLDRVYLPQDWMAEAGVGVDALAAPRASPGLRRVLDRTLAAIRGPDGHRAGPAGAASRPSPGHGIGRHRQPRRAPVRAPRARGPGGKASRAFTPRLPRLLRARRDAGVRMTARRNLVTGGCGFIGRHLVRQLLDAGETVRVLDLADRALAPEGAEYMGGSITDAEAVRAALVGVDRLYHLAGMPYLWAPDKRSFERVNHGGTRIVLEAAAGHELDRIVYTSTESILKSYRRRNPGEPADERTELALADMPGPYCRSKFRAEQAAFAAAARGQPVVVVNPTLPVGPGDHRLTPPTEMILNFLSGRAPAYLDCALNLADVRDVARGHVLAAENGRIGERYILGGENLRLSEVLAMLGELADVAMPRIRVPYWLAWTMGAISEAAADLVTRRPPLAPLTGVRLAASAMLFDSSKARRELGLPQTPIRKSLADAVAWLADEGPWRPHGAMHPAAAGSARAERQL